MGKSQKALPPQVRAWVEARKRHRLSHAQVQLARELGLNPGKLGKISNHRQEPVGGCEETGAECCRHERPR
jgi:hypothetical protein